MKQAEPSEVLRQFVSDHPTQTHAAAALDITPAYLSDLLNGRRGFSARMLEALGLKKIVVKSHEREA